MANAQPLTWINANDSNARWRVKSHARREVKRRKQSKQIQENARGKPRALAPAQSNRVPVLEVVPLLQAQSPTTLLGAGRVDPFTVYPVEMMRQDHRLADHFVYNAPQIDAKLEKRACFLPVLQSVRAICYEVALNDPAAFLVILAVSCADIALLHGESDSLSAVKFDTKSIGMLKDRIARPTEATSDGTLATIALRVLFELLFKDCDSIGAHLDALAHLVKLRGGIDIIEESNPQLARLLNLADYLPPISALAGIRRYYPNNTKAASCTPGPTTANLPPTGLEGLAQFDIYHDIQRIADLTQSATIAIASGDFHLYIQIEATMNTQLSALLSIGSSMLAWSRRCEILICIDLAALIYLRTIYTSGTDPETVINLLMRQFCTTIPTSSREWTKPARLLLLTLLESQHDNSVALKSYISELMILGSRLNRLFWLDIKFGLIDLHSRMCTTSLSPLGELDPVDRNTSALTTLFGGYAGD